MKKLFHFPFRANRAMVFVDYEYWFYSLRNKYRLQPDPTAWRTELEAKYNLSDVMVFADFSSPGLNDELGSLRSMTNTIIETGNPSRHHKKDMTDFVMLDYIYQCANSRRDIGTYILFTGDQHFQSVVKYLTQKKHKKVVLYGILGTMSSKLEAVATETALLPFNEQTYGSCRQHIIENMAYVGTRNDIIPTFMGTTDAICRRHGLDPELVKAALRRMLDEGHLYQREERVSFNRKVNTIAANWDKLIADGLWKP